MLNIHGLFYVSRKDTRLRRLEANFFPHTFSISSQIQEEGKRLGPTGWEQTLHPHSVALVLSWLYQNWQLFPLDRKRRKMVFCLQASSQTEPQGS